MKILFITDNFPPEVNAPATRTFEHIQEWQKDDDVEVTVLTCAPNFPHGKVYKGYKNKIYNRENYQGIDVIRVWSFIAANKGFISRIIDYVSFANSAFLVGLFLKYDIIIATSPQFFTTWTAYALSKIRRKPWIFELRDLWPESIKTVGAMKQGRIIDALEKIELFLYKDANVVVPVTDAFKKNLIDRGINSEKIKVVTNGSNMELFSPRIKDNKLLNDLINKQDYSQHTESDNNGIEKSNPLCGKDKFIVGYIGTHGLAHSLDFIVHSLAKIKNKNIHFLFIGDGAIKETIVSIAKKLNLKNITFLPPIPKEDVPKYLSIIDVSLAPLKKEDNFKTVIPSKIFEASAMKKPTLLGVEGQALEIIEQYNAGLCFEPENENDFLEKLELIRSDKKLYIELQEGCRILAKAFDRNKLANKMLDIIKDIVL